MESLDQSKEKEIKDKRLTNRLRLATTRVKDAEPERIWALAQAHAEGLSIRTIAKVTGLSSSRIHQLLHTDEADQIPDWLNDLSASLSEIEFESEDRQKLELSELQQELASEGEVLSIISWCLYSRRIILVGEGFFNVNFFLSDYPKGLAESSTCYAIASRCA